MRSDQELRELQTKMDELRGFPEEGDAERLLHEFENLTGEELNRMDFLQRLAALRALSKKCQEIYHRLVRGEITIDQADLELDEAEAVHHQRS